MKIEFQTKSCSQKNIYHAIIFQVINEDQPHEREKPKSLKEQAIADAKYYHTKTNVKPTYGQSLLIQRPQGSPSRFSHLNKTTPSNSNNLDNTVQNSIPKSIVTPSSSTSTLNNTPKASAVKMDPISRTTGLFGLFGFYLFVIL